jgi:hypothetical protein
MRIATVTGTIGLALATTTLAACGSHGTAGASGDYCQELTTDKTFFQSLDGSKPDLTRLDDMFRRMHSLAAAAPAGVASDWKTLDRAVSTIEGALADAGLTPDDLAEMQKGQVPAGVDVDKLAALAPTMKALAGSQVNDAADHIAADAKSGCELSESPTVGPPGMLLP